MNLILAAASGVAPQKTILDGFISVGGIIILVGLIGSVITILRALKANRTENEAAQQQREDRFMDKIDKHNDSVEDRLKDLELTSRDFMPRAEIEKAIEHEKQNRLTSQGILKDAITQAAKDIVDIRVGQGKMEQKQDGLSSDMSELKNLLKEQGKDTAARLDKLNDCLTTIARKVA